MKDQLENLSASAYGLAKRGIACRLRQFTALLLVSLTILGLSACSSSKQDTASGSAVQLDTQAEYVKAFLDALCREDYEAYAKACSVPVSEVKEDGPEYIKSIIENEFTYIPSDAMVESFAGTLQKLFAKCRYTVKPAVQNDNGSYSIPVSIQKFNVFKTALDKGDRDYNEWKKGQSDDMDADVMTDKFFEFITKYCEEEMKAPQYAGEETVTVTLTVSKEDDGIYTYGEEDIDHLLYGLMDLSAWDDLVAEEEEE